MRRTALIMIFLISAISGYSQKSVDKIFEKYSGSDGFLTLTINGDILKILRSCHQVDDHSGLPAKITEIRILARENGGTGADNFYKNVMKELDRNDYEEFMSVKESHQDMIMLVKSEGRRFREFLLVAGGDDDNVIVQVKGDMSLDEAHRFSGEMKKDCCTGFIPDKK